MPEFSGISAWLNSPPLTVESLRGKVVLVQFWTYSCINCLRTLPYVTKWHEQYKGKGLVVVGVHAPNSPSRRNVRMSRPPSGAWASIIRWHRTISTAPGAPSEISTGRPRI